MPKSRRRSPRHILTADVIRRIGKGGPPPGGAAHEPIPERFLELLRQLEESEQHEEPPR